MEISNELIGHLEELSKSKNKIAKEIIQYINEGHSEARIKELIKEDIRELLIKEKKNDTE